MSVISMIAAVTRSGAIGRGGDMLFHIPADLRHFKALTMGKPVIMGRKTWESLPGGALPGRLNIVITRQAGSYDAPGAKVTASLEEALSVTADCPEVMIIGGGEIYRQALPLADRIYLTRIDADADGCDTFFPRLKADEWIETGTEGPIIDQKSGLNLHFVCLSRK